MCSFSLLENTSASPTGENTWTRTTDKAGIDSNPRKGIWLKTSSQTHFMQFFLLSVQRQGVTEATSISLSLCPSFSLSQSLLNFFTSLSLNQDKNRAMTSNSQNVCNRCQNCKSLQTSILHNASAISITVPSPMRKAVMRMKVGFKLSGL